MTDLVSELFSKHTDERQRSIRAAALLMGMEEERSMVFSYDGRTFDFSNIDGPADIPRIIMGDQESIGDTFLIEVIDQIDRSIDRLESKKTLQQRFNAVFMELNTLRGQFNLKLKK
jgi:hypothetical protein